MEIQYLKNGQQCVVRETLQNGKLLVERLHLYTHYVGGDGDEEEYSEPSGDVEIVDAVYPKAPTEVYDTEIVALQVKVDELQGTIATLKQEERKLSHAIDTLSKTVISKEKYIVNRSHLLAAKEIVAFPANHAMPVRIKEGIRGIRVSISLTIITGEENAWVYELHGYGGRGDSYSQNLDPKSGILIDPTEEEIEEVIRKRVLEVPDAWDLKNNRVPDKYLTPELLSIKEENIRKEKDTQRVNLCKQVADLQERISLLA